MGFEPMISGMKILRPRRTERRCCLKYLVYNHFLSKPSDLFDGLLFDFFLCHNLFSFL